MIASVLTRVFRRTPPPLTAQEESWVKLEADVNRRKLEQGIPYAARRASAMKAVRHG